jgi:hypothetical protein
MLHTKLNKISQVSILILIVKLSLLNLMEIPHHIHAQGIQPHCLYHHYAMLPILNRNSGIMDLPSKDLILEVLGHDWGEALVLGSVVE